MGLIKTIHKEAIIKGNVIEIDGVKSKIIKGKHSIWIPEPEMKIPWTFNGKITSFKDWEKGRHAKEIEEGTFGGKDWDIETLQSIINEYRTFEKLSEVGISPPMEGMFRIKSVTSDFYPGKTTTDVKGVYGYYMRDANELDTGNYTFGLFLEKFIDKIELSEWTLERTDRYKGIYGGALGDLIKTSNTVNGWLVDIRRSLFDCITLKDLPKDAYKELIC